MANALDYLGWRGDLTFEASPFNEVDMFLCSMLSTPSYKGVIGKNDEPLSLGEASEKYFKTHTMERNKNIGVLQSEYLLPAFKKMGESERFRDVKLWRPINKVIEEKTEQFCAVTLCFPDGGRLISIRGTDDTIIGWKEDFEIAYNPCVAAQQDAVDYLREIAEECPDSDLYICGHSKGGNLAIYAAAMVPEDIQSRIKYVISYDGPGFRESFKEDEGYIRIKDRVYTILSQNSMIGTLLTRVGKIEFVKTTEHGPAAHDGFTWEVMGKEFIPSEGLSDTSIKFEKAMRETLADMNDAEREEFTNALFDTILEAEVKTVNEFVNLPTKEKYDILKRLRDEKKVTAFAKSFLSVMLKEFESEIISKI